VDVSPAIFHKNQIVNADGIHSRLARNMNIKGLRRQLITPVNDMEGRAHHPA